MDNQITQKEYYNKHSNINKYDLMSYIHDYINLLYDEYDKYDEKIDFNIVKVYNNDKNLVKCSFSSYDLIHIITIDITEKLDIFGHKKIDNVDNIENIKFNNVINEFICGINKNFDNIIQIDIL